MIHIFYRHTNATKIGPYRPEWFSYNKCFVNLLKTIALYKDVVKLNVVFDGDIGGLGFRRGGSAGRKKTSRKGQEPVAHRSFVPPEAGLLPAKDGRGHQQA